MKRGMSEVNIKIDGREVKAKKGDKVLWAALDAGVYIPHLCSAGEIEPARGACRLCFVEVKGYKEPVTSCTLTVEEGMEITTRTPRVERLVKSAYSLLMSVHRLDCRNCPANRKCGLQEVAKKMKLPLRQKVHQNLDFEYPADDSRPDFGLDPNRCILCGKCIWVCNTLVECRVLDFINRGLRTVVGTFGDTSLAEQDSCTGCLKCVEYCPTGALYVKGEKEETAAGT